MQFDFYFDYNSGASGWNFHLSETFADGWGGTSPASEATEVHNYGKGFNVAANLLPGHKLYGNQWTPDVMTNHVTVIVGDQHVEVDNHFGFQRCYKSKFLFTLLEPVPVLYFGINRVMNLNRYPDPPRIGQGLCEVLVKTFSCP